MSEAQPAERVGRHPFDRRLEAVQGADWDFANSGTKERIHGIHPYPAKFIPQIPRKLITLLKPLAGKAIFDPFCGSGTTLVEAQDAGYRSIGVDLNPIAALISKVKTHPPSEPIAPLAEQISLTAVDSPATEDIPRLDHWFQPEVQRALQGIVNGIAQISNESQRDALRVALSSIVVRVSNQESDTRYAAIQKQTSPELVHSLFRRAAAEIDQAHSNHSGGLFARKLPPAKILSQDVLTLKPSDVSERVGLVITSPPYPNAYEYWLYHKYRMYWLGFDPIAVRTAEMGARPHYFKKNHQTEADFERQMGRVFELISNVLEDDGLVCFLVGRSIIHGRTINNAELLERAAAQHGLVRLLETGRSIPSTRKAFNPTHGTIAKETLLVFGR